MGMGSRRLTGREDWSSGRARWGWSQAECLEEAGWVGCEPHGVLNRGSEDRAGGRRSGLRQSVPANHFGGSRCENYKGRPGVGAIVPSGVAGMLQSSE